MPDAPQEFASGLDTDLRKLAQQVQNSERDDHKARKGIRDTITKFDGMIAH